MGEEMKTDYVLIDYENVQSDAIAVLNEEPFKVIVFVGANQTKVSFEVASALQRMGDRAEYVRISCNGSNALDFHMAFYIGQLAMQAPDLYFHIVAKDSKCPARTSSPDVLASPRYAVSHSRSRTWKPVRSKTPGTNTSAPGAAAA